LIVVVVVCFCVVFGFVCFCGCFVCWWVVLCVGFVCVFVGVDVVSFVVWVNFFVGVLGVVWFFFGFFEVIIIFGCLFMLFFF
jgi:hypothetical protein